MAKKSTGASEINGFIAVGNDKPKVAAKKSISSSPSTKSSKDGAKASAESSAVKKVKKVETSKIVTKPVASSSDAGKKVVKLSSSSVTNAAAKKSNNVAAPTSKTNAPKASTLKPGPAKSRTPIKNELSTTKSSSVRKDGPSRTKPKETTPLTKPTKDPKQPTRTPKDTKLLSKPAQNIKKPTVTDQSSKSVTRTPTVKRTVQPKNQNTAHARVNNKKPEPLKPKKEDNGDPNTKVWGKSGLSFNVTLEPAKANKQSTSSQQVGNAEVTSVDDVQRPPLIKQGTFVKDEEDEELKSSLPHIGPPEVADSAQDSVQYQEDDFEDYESDFENTTESEDSSVAVRKPSSSRPRTAKLKSSESTEERNENGSAIVSSEPQVLEQSLPTEESEDLALGKYDYEDDFEEYSSDFEDDTESGFTSSNETPSTTDSSEIEEPDANKAGLKGKMVEEERKLDSGNYDLKTTIMRSDVIKQTQLNDIKEAISRENTMFKDGVPIEKSPSPPPVQIMDFKAAFDRTKPSKKKVQYERGQTLMSMIKLHVMDYHLFEMQPVAYDEFIRLRGNANSTQVQTQTNEDDLEEETQTDEVILDNKWTQWPAAYHSWKDGEPDWGTYLEDKKGFGSDEPPVPNTSQLFTTNYNVKRLQNFVTYASQIMTVLLEEETLSYQDSLSLQGKDPKFGFSDGFVPITGKTVEILAGRIVTHVGFSPHFSNVVFTCYDRKGSVEEDVGRWLICLWDMISVARPTKVLTASAPIETVIFDCLYADLVFAGLSDGTICLWDLSEPDADHDHFRPTNSANTLRTPTYCSFSSEFDATESHTSPVICLKSASSGGVRDAEDDLFVPTTLYSLGEDGKFVIWTVVRVPHDSMNRQKIDVRISPWGRVRLALTSVHQPKERAPQQSRPGLDFLCMEVKLNDVPAALLGTNMGFVLQYPLMKFKSVTPQFGETNAAVRVTAIELCPHDARCFLVGLSDGTLRLHSELTSRVLKVFSPPHFPSGAIASVKWSPFKPGIVVSLDRNANLHVWDLCKSDLHPVVKMSLKAPKQSEASIISKNAFDRASCCRQATVRAMDLSRDARLPYLGLVVSDSTVHVHRLNEEFSAAGASEDDLTVMKNYLNLFHK